MPSVPILRPSEVIRGFEAFGWIVVRQRGSHVIMVKAGHIVTLSIPSHQTVARGTLRSLIARAGLSVEEFIGALNN